MGENRGKQFENIIKEAFEKVNNTSVIRLHDQTSGFRGSFNPCDFIVYHYPNMYAIECKSIHGNTFPLSNITDNQYKGLLNLSKTYGIIAGVICWWVDKDVTKFIPIQMIQALKNMSKKSIRYDEEVFCDSNGYGYVTTTIKGKKKRVFFDYNFNDFFKEVSK